jgi:mannose-6-phosphate isomerase
MKSYFGYNFIMTIENIPPLILKPSIRNYLWGGRHLARLANEEPQSSSIPIAEAWVVYEGNLIQNDPFVNLTLSDLTKQYPQSILGPEVARINNNRFPLLIKLLDCAKWLSIQVHPDNNLALELEGPGHSGKTEAWYVLGANNDAQLIAGTRPGITAQQLEIAIRNGTILDVIQRHSINRDDAILINAGTIHALGPGTLIYEVQQTSDITYRVYDWDRPLTTGRELHIEKSIAAGKPYSTKPFSTLSSDIISIQSLIKSDFFQLEKCFGSKTPSIHSTNGISFHTITIINGQLDFSADKFHHKLELFDTILIPASIGKYQLTGEFQALKARTNLET